MYLLGQREKLTHWYSNNEIEQLNLFNMNNLLKTGQIQPWMQCNNDVTKSVHQAPAATSSDSGGGAASSVIGAASAAPLAAQGPCRPASQPDALAKANVARDHIASLLALQKKA